MPPLTPQQKRAAETARHVAVVAGPGTGKTTVLVARYLHLLLVRDAPAERIVVMTFTDRAAAELRRRIAEALEAEIRQAGPDRSPLLLHAREVLPSAPLGTVHAFCARLLREYGPASGRPPFAGILEGTDRRELIRRATRQELEGVIARARTDPFRQAVLGLFHAAGRAAVLRWVDVLLQRRWLREFVEESIFTLSDDAVLQLWREKLEAVAADIVNSRSFAADLVTLATDAPGRSAASVLSAATSLERSATLGERVDVALTAISKIFRKDGRLMDAFAGSRAATLQETPEVERLLVWRDVLPALRDALGSEGLTMHPPLLAASRTLLSLVHGVAESYRQAKRRAGLLDFDDLEHEALDLLSDEQLRRAVASHYRWVLVDEYQDTSPAQEQLLFRLHDGLASGELSVVGDPWQSIYAFRQADVSLFTKAADAIARHEEGEYVVLDLSFRFLPGIAAAANALAQSAPPGAQKGTTVHHGRRGGAPGRVELLLADSADDELPEAERIARRLRQLLDGESTVSGYDERQRTPLPQDIAVLLRNRTLLEEIESALSHHGIPSVVIGGIGFFQRQEVLDAAAYLQFLADPSDDVSLAAILRSPFFHLSDPELLLAGMDRGIRTLWEAIRLQGAKEGAPSAVRRAAEALSADLALVGHVPASFLLRHALDRTSYAAASDAAGPGPVSANLAKLLATLRTIERRGFATLRDTVARLRQLIREEDREAQASWDTTAEGVRIMTIHAAKGLEFPIVLLPGLHRPFQYDQPPFIDSVWGIGLDAVDPQREEDPPLTRFLRAQSRVRSTAEEHRLLYVGATRARDMLIVSGNQFAMRPGRSSLPWVLRAFGLRTADLHAGGLTQGSVPDTATDGSSRISILYSSDLPLLPSLKKEPESGIHVPQLLVDPLDTRKRPLVLSLSALQAYAECPFRYYERYIQGVRIWSGNAGRRAVAVHDGAEETEDSDMAERPHGALHIHGITITGKTGRLSRAADGNWILQMTTVQEKGEPPEIVEAMLFRLRVEALMIRKIHRLRALRTRLLFVNSPDRSVDQYISEERWKSIEEEVARVVTDVRDARYEHRADPCPVCHFRGTVMKGNVHPWK